MLSLFTVDTGRYERQKFGYRKRTGPCKLNVQLPLVEERLSLIVRLISLNQYLKFLFFIMHISIGHSSLLQKHYKCLNIFFCNTK